MADVEAVLCFVEEMFVKHGARRADFGGYASYPDFGLRPSFVLNGMYYRAESAVFDDVPVILITASDKKEFAAVGIQDNIAGFPASLPEESLEKEVLYALGLEPYPADYPLVSN